MVWDNPARAPSPLLGKLNPILAEPGQGPMGLNLCTFFLASSPFSSSDHRGGTLPWSFSRVPEGKVSSIPHPPTSLMEPPGHHPLPRDFWSALNFSHAHPLQCQDMTLMRPFSKVCWGRSLAVIKCLALSSLSAPSFCHAGLAQREWIQPEDSPPT